MSKVVFLDFDGVIVTAADRFKAGDPRCVKALNRLTAQTGADLVVSSAWRIGRTVAELRHLLHSWGVRARVLDRTPKNWSWERGHEIQHWLSGNPHVKQFVILDDDRDMAHLMPWLVRTDTMRGLTERDVDLAKLILGAERKRNEEVRMVMRAP